MEQLDNLPDEVLLNIFTFFNKRDHGQASTVNKHFSKVLTDKSLSNLPWPLLDYSQQPYAVKLLNDKVQNIVSSTMLDNEKIILSTSQGNLYVCDVGQNGCQLLNETHPNHTLLALSIGLVISSAGYIDNTLKVWDINRGHSLKTLVGHTGIITALTELPNGYVVSTSEDNTLKVWDIEKGKCLISINTGLTNPIKKLITLSNGNILCGLPNGALQLWDVINNYKRLYSLIGHGASINALVELPTGEVLSASDDGTCKLWNIDSRLCLDTFKEPAIFNNNSRIIKFIVLPNKEQIACLTSSYDFDYPGFFPKNKIEGTEPSVWIWDMQAKTYLHSLIDNRTYLSSLYILPNGQIITLGEKGLECWLFPELKFKHKLSETNLSSNLNKPNFN